MRKILFGALLVIVLIAEVLVVYHQLSSRSDMVFDFLLRWHGAHALIFEGKDPYSQEVTNQIQMEILGRTPSPGECQQGFLYPVFIAFTVPHFLLPARLALSVWIVTQQVLLVLCIWLVLASTRQQERLAPPSLFALTLGGTMYMYSLQNLGYAQFSIYVLFWLALTWWLWEKGRYLHAGTALTLVTTKPQLAFVVVPLWLLLAMARRRWSFVAGFSVIMAGWLIMPCLLVGNWFSGFLSMAEQAADTCQSPIYEGSTLPLRLGISIFLLAALGVVWFISSRKQVEPDMGFLLSLSVTVTLGITPFVHHYDLVLTLLPLLHGLNLLSQTRGRAAVVLKVMYWGTLLILPWALWGLAPDQIQKPVHLWLIPPIVLVLLAATLLLQRGQRETGDALPE